MRFDFLEIEQFRGVQNLRLKNLGDVNLLLGDNDAGKTTVLEAIKAFEVPNDINRVIYHLNARTRGVGTPNWDNYSVLERLLGIFPLSQKSKKATLHAGIDRRDHTLDIAGELLHIMRPVGIEEVLYGTAPDEEPEQTTIDCKVPTFSGTLCYDGKSTPFEIDDLYRRKIVIKEPESIVYLAPGDHLLGKNTASLYTTSKRQETQIVSLLQLIDPDIEGLKLQPGGIPGSLNQTIEHKRFGNIPLYIYGDGIKKILSLAANVLNAKGGVLLIDEIETSLQASNLRHIFTWLFHACRQFHVQLFVTTHSLEAVSALVSCAVKDRESELACYRLEADNGRTFGNRFSESDLDSMVNGRGFDVR